MFIFAMYPWFSWEYVKIEISTLQVLDAEACWCWLTKLLVVIFTEKDVVWNWVRKSTYRFNSGIGVYIGCVQYIAIIEIQS